MHSILCTLHPVKRTFVDGITPERFRCCCKRSRTKQNDGSTVKRPVVITKAADVTSHQPRVQTSEPVYPAMVRVLTNRHVPPHDGVVVGTRVSTVGGGRQGRRLPRSKRTRISVCCDFGALSCTGDRFSPTTNGYASVSENSSAERSLSVFCISMRSRCVCANDCLFCLPR